MQYALVAGGSKGICYAIAEALAKRKYDLILIGRHPATLHSAKNKLVSQYHVQVEILIFDLSEVTAAEEIAEWCGNLNSSSLKSTPVSKRATSFIFDILNPKDLSDVQIYRNINQAVKTFIN
jgi:NAD(P)-dependent dehydrogenase (short-subunit alcohol dehydrogenase family)